jgi:soluble lytic murein transglycosylase-like protein
MVADFGWGIDQYSCLAKLWDRESNWRVNALNKSSGAYGIPQSLPATKMASEGADWLTNPETQIRWGIKYIKGRYGTPCGALAHSNKFNWY